ncbi:cytochrome P450 [Boletus coccyginus]|nr:cytochrome P450 [Boletus coccyginus]
MHSSDLFFPAFLLGGLLLGYQWSLFQGKLRLINNHAGHRSITKKTSIWPSFFGLSPEKTVTWKEKYTLFQRFGWDIVSAVSWFPQPAIAFFVADPVAVKEITLRRWNFPKHMGEYKILEMFGPNLVTTEGDVWKRHRKISSPTYSEKTNALVWVETCRIASNTFSEWGNRFECNSTLEFTLTFALKVISVTGFGIHYDALPAAGHQMSFGEAISIVSRNGFLKLLIPEWAMCLTPRLRRTKAAFDELWAYLDQLVEDHHKEKASSESQQRDDLFSALLRANQADDGSTEHLNRDELFGNIFIGFFAGHETTSVTLAFILIQLARHPEEQERLYRDVTSVLQGCPKPTYSDAHRFVRTIAVINETLRMYPPVTGLPKQCSKATTLTCAAANSSDDRMIVPIPEGSTVIVDVPGLHYNEKYWKNPFEWNPDRYLTEWNADAFAPFSIGARACIGRKFFETEAIALISMLVAHYEIQLAPGSLVPSGEIDVTAGITLIPKGMPLVFCKRKHD